MALAAPALGWPGKVPSPNISPNHHATGWPALLPTAIPRSPMSLALL